MDIDLALVAGFDWDEGNSDKSLMKHGVSQREAEQVFFGAPLAIVRDIVHSVSEQRFHAFGQTDAGRRLQISFTLRAEGGLIRVISARAMSRGEKERYDAQA